MVPVAQAKTQNFDAQVADFLIPVISCCCSNIFPTISSLILSEMVVLWTDEFDKHFYMYFCLWF